MILLVLSVCLSCSWDADECIAAGTHVSWQRGPMRDLYIPRLSSNVLSKTVLALSKEV
jgi:hypothetical protein